MPSRIVFTSVSVAAKISWIFAVTSARFASSFVLVLPLSATSAASAAPLALCMPATASVVWVAASVLPCAMTCCSCWRNCAGAVSAWAAAACLSARACWNSGSLDCASCGSVTSASAISWPT